jgi:hypothetical protein
MEKGRAPLEKVFLSKYKKYVWFYECEIAIALAIRADNLRCDLRHYSLFVISKENEGILYVTQK